MATGNDAAASLHCVAIRVATLAADGTTPAGNSMYVTDSIVKLDFNPEVETGPETVMRNAAGALCIVYKLPDIIKRYAVSLQICTPDPELEAILSGGTVLTSGGNIMGYQYPALRVDPVPNGLSIEAWTHAIVNGDIASANPPYMWWAFPKVFNLHKTNRTLDANPLNNTFDGKSGENPNWGNGPNNDWKFDSTKSVQWIRTGSFPTPAIGAQTVPVQV